jgi:hypothetical protein
MILCARGASGVWADATAAEMLNKIARIRICMFRQHTNPANSLCQQNMAAPVSLLGVILPFFKL